MDLAALAYNIIHNVIKIKQKQIINLSAEIHNGYDLDNPLIEIPLLEEMALEIRKAGGFAVLDIASENLRKRVFTEMNSNNLKLPAHYYEKWVSLADVFIDFGWLSNPYFTHDIPSYYLSNYNKSAKELWDQIQIQMKKVVLMGFPTEALAKFYNLNYSVLREKYFAAINIEYYFLKKHIVLVDEKLKKSNEWNLITEDRNLAFTFLQQNSMIYNGDFLNRCYIILPTGKIEKQIVHLTLDGIFYAESVYLDNQYYTDIQIIFEKGKVISVDFLNRQNNSNFLHSLLFNPIQEAYLCLGMNSALQEPIRYSLFDECVLKNCTIKLVINNKLISLANSKAKLYEHDQDILSEV
ncbi:MAG TPA: hypothetical protein PKJ08_12725 [Candidatus Cloacimonadota bacterium]|nr:hypothetical protein [Candidatus Cloacimonadota bacterium]HPM02089.1 hypothetical protein [Candidatus Cloacimonadota bacterium]